MSSDAASRRSAGHGPAALAHQFDDLEQQRDATALGMWIFLVTEMLFFGGLFVTYLVYRTAYPEAFAEASRTLDLFWGATNTVVLLASSFTMALAVAGSARGDRAVTTRYLLTTMALGLVFLVIKAVEYRHKFEEHHVPGWGFTFEGTDPEHAPIFFSLYFVMTGVHALHMVIGIGVLTVVALMARRDRFSREYYSPVELSGLYWHFVDIVWIFLFPLLYLISRHA
jgi:cytochrome c oxidase subunit 3